MANTCCPAGYVYIDGSGGFNDPGFGTGTLSNPVAALPPFFNKCAVIVNRTWGQAPAIEPIACLCCPPNYTFSSFSQACFSPTAPVTIPIPCIVCTCTTVEPPVCGNCGTGGLPINFNLNLNIKNCTECTTQENQLTCNGRLNNFMPSQVISPIMNFILKNKNFI